MVALTTTGASPTNSQRQVFADVIAERKRQDAKHGPVPPTRKHGTSELNKLLADHARQWCQYQAETGTVTWADILAEEYWEAMAEEEWPELRAELIQVIAVGFSWIEDGDKKHAAKEERRDLHKGFATAYSETQDKGRARASERQGKGGSQVPPEDDARDDPRAVHHDQGVSERPVRSLPAGEGLAQEGTGS